VSMDKDRQMDYQSYLLRLGRVSGKCSWRAYLESADAGQRRGFADLDALFRFLRSQTAPRPVARPEWDGGNGKEKSEQRRWSSDTDCGRIPQCKYHLHRIFKLIKERIR
jgi:hypothetical protein